MMFAWILIIIVSLFGCATGDSVKIEPIATYKHDSMCFTQGLILQDNVLYESCGLTGKSSLRIVDYQTGQVLKRQRLEAKYFAEGIALLNDRIYMLTWKNKQMLVFDAKTLTPLGDLAYETHTGEGWGLTYDGHHFITSDGSNRLTFFQPPSLDAKQLVKVKHIEVMHPTTNKPITHINELQYVNGFIYANIWYKDVIIKIDINSGAVVETYDLSALYPHKIRSPHADCLNGIAYNAVDGTFLLTGKKWPKYYSVNFGAIEGRKDL